MLLAFASFTEIMSWIGRVLLAFVILMFMVLIHETGHYTAGKLLKFKINEFAVGMGPKILSKTKKNGEVVSLRLLPLGGFCAFEGEDGDVQVEGAFNAQKPWKRIIVLVSGAMFNFISAILICVILFSAYGENVAVVNKVYDYAPTFNQQLQPGDIIYKINGKDVFVLDNISRYMTDEMTVTVIKPNGTLQTYEGVKCQTFYSYNITDVKGTFIADGRKLAVEDAISQIDGKTLYQQGDLLKYLDEAGDTCLVSVVANKEYVYTMKTSDMLNAITVRDTFYNVTAVNGKFTADGHDLAVGDLIYKIDEKVLNKPSDLQKYLKQAGETCTVTVLSEKEFVYEMKTSDMRNSVSVNESPYNGIGMGIHYETHKFSFGTALLRVFPYCGEVAMLVLRTLGGLFTGAVGLNDIGGPITTISVTSQVVSYGFASILSLIVLISVNLAVFNLLPVPALDGCRIVFVIIEWIAGKPINRKVEAWINGIGLILLLGFVILVDLLKL